MRKNDLFRSETVLVVFSVGEKFHVLELFQQKDFLEKFTWHKSNSEKKRKCPLDRTCFSLTNQHA